MKNIAKLSHSELLDHLAEGDTVEVLDLGAVQIHLMVNGSASYLLVENPASENESAIVTLQA